MKTYALDSHAVAELPSDGPLLSTEQDAVDLMSELWGVDVAWIVIPVSRLADDFFRLRNGKAGAFLQKVTNYGRRAAFVGDLPEELAASEALRDFVFESNARRTTLFARDHEELATLLR